MKNGLLIKSLGLTAGILAAFAGTAQAASIYVETIPASMPVAQKEVRAALTHHHFKVVMNIDILRKIDAKQKMLHIPNFNKPGYSDVRALVFCNPFLFSGLLNGDSKTASVCPLNLTLYSKGKVTTVAYAERSAYTKGTGAQAVGEKIDHMVIGSLKSIPGSHS